MKNTQIRDLILLALFADIGFIAKRMIGPFANVLTDFLRVPGGIGTAFSLMFLCIGACLIRRKGAASMMALVQCVLAMSFGMTGAMGMLSPVGYLVPGIVIDLVIAISQRMHVRLPFMMLSANAAGSFSAALTADLIVFHLHGAVLALYLLVALISGAVFSLPAVLVYRRILPLYQNRNAGESQRGKSE